MKNKYILIMALLTLTLFSAACAAQDATNEPAVTTAISTISADDDGTPVGTSEAALTPTGAVNGATPAQGTAETSTTPTVSADGTTPTEGAAGTAIIPQTGSGVAGTPDDLDEIMRSIRETGATVEFGDTVQHDFFSVAGQTIRINGEDVQFFIYDSAEQLEAQASQVADDGGSIGTTMVTWEDQPHFYKLGNMLVLYVGRDPEVRDLLEDVLGAQFAGR